MSNKWVRLGFVLGVVFVMGAGVWALAVDFAGINPDKVDIVKRDTAHCAKLRNYCYSTCGERPYPGVGVCREGKDGPESAITIECCCCTDGWKQRYFIGG